MIRRLRTFVLFISPFQRIFLSTALGASGVSTSWRTKTMHSIYRSVAAVNTPLHRFSKSIFNESSYHPHSVVSYLAFLASCHKANDVSFLFFSRLSFSECSSCRLTCEPILRTTGNSMSFSIISFRSIYYVKRHHTSPPPSPFHLIFHGISLKPPSNLSSTQNKNQKGIIFGVLGKKS